MHTLPRFSRPALVAASLVFAVLLASCGGADKTNPSLVETLINGAVSSNATSSSANSGSSGTGTDFSDVTPNPDLTPLDCTKLDPDVVYMLGTLGGPYPAVMNPENPPNFCVYFPGRQLGSLVTVTKSGSLLYKFTDVYKKTKSELLGGTPDAGSPPRWYYLEDAFKSDAVLFDAEEEDELARNTLLTRYDATAATDEVFSQSGKTIYLHNAGTLPYVNNADGTMLGVMPDGSLLMDGSSGLYLLDQTLKTTKLTNPSSGTFTFHASKLFISPASGSQDAWILAQSNTDRKVFSRWNLNLTTNILTDDGSYAPIPDGVNVGSSAKLNGAGELIQLGTDSTNPDDFTNKLVMKRPLQSSGQLTTIIFRDDAYTGNFAWGSDVVPFIHVGPLVTGP